MQKNPVGDNSTVALLIAAVAILALEGADVVRLELQKHSQVRRVFQASHDWVANRQEESRIKSLLAGLVLLAEKDNDARAILTKYGIQATEVEGGPTAGDSR
jgi:hypothetical protein